MYESEHDADHWNTLAAETAEQIEQEERLWKQQGLHAGMVVIDARLIQMKVNTLVGIVQDLGVTNEELDAKFKVRVLAQMRADREMLIRAKAEAARPDIAVARKPGLLGPDGTPII